MSESTEAKISVSITCPYCDAPSAGSLATESDRDETGPVKVLYKCSRCGKFYTGERVICWRVKKT
jgi:DNA-directed RNA polymerase subunit RPC12/RpoP